MSDAVRIGSLCSGYEGLDLGLIAYLNRSGIDAEVAWHFEYDDNPAAILAYHNPGTPNYRDITAHDFHDIEPVDWLTAGYPCQPFSHAGKRKGSKDERHLWPDVARAISVLRPRNVLLENVAGHLTLGLATVLADLARMGYSATWGVVRASDAGAPHRRARVFIVARPDAPDTQGSPRRIGDGDSEHAPDAAGRRRDRGTDQQGLPRPTPVRSEESDTPGHHDQRPPTDPDRRGLGRLTPSDPRPVGHEDVTPGDDVDRRRDPATDTGSQALTLRTGLRPSLEAGIGRRRPDDDRGETDSGAGATTTDAQRFPHGKHGDAGGMVSPPSRRSGEDRDPARPSPASSGPISGRGTPVVSGRRRPEAGPPTDAPSDRWDERETQSTGQQGRPHAPVGSDVDRSGAAGRAPDAGSPRLQGHDELTEQRRPQVPAVDNPPRARWGVYEPAIRRWEIVLGRPAPYPTEATAKGAQRLSPTFVEWMMGLPPGWVTDVPGLNRSAQLKALGNGVVPQCATLALRMLLDT